MSKNTDPQKSAVFRGGTRPGKIEAASRLASPRGGVPMSVPTCQQQPQKTATFLGGTRPGGRPASLMGRVIGTRWIFYRISNVPPQGVPGMVSVGKIGVAPLAAASSAAQN